MFGADADAHEQVEVGRRDAVLRSRADDLLQFLDRIEAEGPDAMLEISFGDDLFGLHRVHEAQDSLRKRLMDEANLADRRDVVVSDTRTPQDPEQVGRWIRLHRIERAPRELLDEETGSTPRSMRAQQGDRLDRTLHGDCGSPPATGRGGG